MSRLPAKNLFFPFMTNGISLKRSFWEKDLLNASSYPPFAKSSNRTAGSATPTALTRSPAGQGSAAPPAPQRLRCRQVPPAQDPRAPPRRAYLRGAGSLPPVLPPALSRRRGRSARSGKPRGRAGRGAGSGRGFYFALREGGSQRRPAGTRRRSSEKRRGVFRTPRSGGAQPGELCLVPPAALWVLPQRVAAPRDPERCTRSEREHGVSVS